MVPLQHTSRHSPAHMNAMMIPLPAPRRHEKYYKWGEDTVFMVSRNIVFKLYCG